MLTLTMPSPPYRRGSGSPRNPSRASASMTSRRNTPASSACLVCGATSRSAASLVRARIRSWSAFRAKSISAALERGLALLHEAGVEFLEVLGCHEQRLRPRLHLDRGRVVHGGGAVQHLLGHGKAPGGAFLELGSELSHGMVERV